MVPFLIGMADDEDASAARRGHRLDDPRAPHAVVRRRELAVLHRDHEGLRNEVEVFGAFNSKIAGVYCVRLAGKVARTLFLVLRRSYCDP